MATETRYCLIAMKVEHGQELSFCAMCAACVDSFGFAFSIRDLRSLGVVGIYASSSIMNSQTLSGLHCNYCSVRIDGVRPITSSEFHTLPPGPTRILIRDGMSFLNES
jgi:hypothetical protein